MLILFDAKKGRFVFGKGIIIFWLQSKKHYDQILAKKSRNTLAPIIVSPETIP